MVKLKENIKRNGLILNLVVRELDTGFYEVLDGNHRLQVARDLGLDMAHVYNMGKITDSKAQRLALEINENTFEHDPLKMGRLMAGLKDSETFEDLSETLPWKREELDNFANMTEFDWKENEYDPSKKPDRNKQDSDEDFSEVRIPSSLVGVFTQEMDRVRGIIKDEVDQDIEPDEVIRPFEVIMVMFSEISSKAIRQQLAGDDSEEE